MPLDLLKLCAILLDNRIKNRFLNVKKNDDTEKELES